MGFVALTANRIFRTNKYAIVVEILDLTNLDRHVPIIIDPIDGCFVGSAFVHRGLLWIFVMAHRFFEEPIGSCPIALCRQKKVDRFGLLINGTIETFPNVFHPNAYFAKYGLFTERSPYLWLVNPDEGILDWKAARTVRRESRGSSLPYLSI
jgi:hypothetical protein